jgi:hypothetical protein
MRQRRLRPKKVGDADLSSKEDESPRPAKRQRPLPYRDLSPKSNQDEVGSHSDIHNDDELNNNKAESDEDDGRPRPAKRKRPSSSYDGPTPKKRKHHLQQRPLRQRRPRSKQHQHSLKSHSPLDQGSRVAAGSSAEGRLPSPAPSAPHATDTDMPPDCCDLGGSSGDILLTLIGVTFCPHSSQCCSFTAVIRDGRGGRGVSLGQLARLTESIGPIGKIGDFTVKPQQQNSFLLTGFNRHASSRLSSSGTTVSTAAEVGSIHGDESRLQLQGGKAVGAGALAWQGG